MEQLVLVGVILLFSILEAAARKRRGAEGSPVELPDEVPGAEREWSRPAERPRASVEPEPEAFSYDDDVGDRVPVRPVPSSTGPTSSEGLVPPDVWEEIARLARGGAAAPIPRAPAPARVPGAPAPRAHVPAPKPSPVPSRPPVHELHDTHPDMGKPLSERRRPLVESLEEPRRATHSEIVAVREMLAAGPSAMRRAVILHEVLGPPAALRGDPYEPGG